MTNSAEIAFRRDRFYRARGGTATMLRIECGRCGGYLCLYQKDGNGRLRRLYWDRVFNATFATAYTARASRSQMQAAVCRGCGHVVGLPMTYARESRLAWRLVPGAVHRTRLDA